MIRIPEDFFQGLQTFSKGMAEFSLRMQTIVSKVGESFRNIDFEKWTKNLVVFIEAFEKLPENQRKAIDELTKCAWYMNSRTGFFIIYDILNLDKSSPNYISDIDEIMLEDLKDNEVRNFQWILDCFKERESILLDAIKDHKIGRYNCSIPVFLNQIDGISREVLNIDKRNNFFKKVPVIKKYKSGKTIKTGKVYPYTKEKADELKHNLKSDNGFIYSFLIYPLERLSCLCYDSADIDKYIDNGTIYCDFSRHGIIHGRDINYGTEVNSYKCISILLYLCTLKEMLIDKAE